jgi:hypothetical protein
MREECRLLSVTMHLTTLHENRSTASRLFAGTGLLLLLVGIVFVPLCSAFLCTMPCCHPASSPLTSAANQDPCCAISRNDTGNNAAVISPAVTQQSALEMAGTIAVLTLAAVPTPPVATGLATQVSRPLDRPLHILNSVFLI